MGLKDYEKIIGKGLGKSLGKSIDDSFLDMLQDSILPPPTKNYTVDSIGQTLTYNSIQNAAKAMEYQSTNTIDLFEEQFENRYDIKFNDFINAFKADHPELVI